MHAILLWLLCSLPVQQTSRPATRPARPPDPLAPQDPAELALMRATYPPYQGFCAVCHGVTGRGDGPLARYLDPRPTNFRKGYFKLVRRRTGLPTEEELIATVKRGLPGSAMPSFGHMPEHMLRMAVRSVLRLAQAGDGEAAAAQEARAASRPDSAREAIALPEPGAVDPARGAALFRANCALCHGEDGKGLANLPFFDATGRRIRPRNFTQGIFKGGAAFEDLMLRVRAGIPYAAMPAFDRRAISDRDLPHLVAFVRRLIPEDAGTPANGPDRRRIPRFRRLFRFGRLSVARAERLPSGPEDPAWDAAPAARPAVVPLDWSRGDRNPALELRALHDGTRIAFRLSWRDASEDVGPQAFDRASLQLCLGRRPALFVEGRFPQARFGIFGPAWTWRADGAVLSSRPDYGGDWIATLDRRLAAGLAGARGPKVRAGARHRDGWWRLQFSRALASPEHPGPKARRLPADFPDTELPLEPGESATLQVALGDHARSFGDLCVTHWIEFALAP